MHAVIFDFNGTLSDDEPLLFRLYAEMFREHLQWTLTPRHYYSRLAGRSDREIVELMVGEGRDLRADRLLDERRRRYHELVSERSPIHRDTADLVRQLHVPLAIVTGAQRGDVDFVLAHSPIAHAFGVIVTEEDVAKGKPHPEGFLRAAAKLGTEPENILVFEDSLPGIRAARAAGMRCIAVEGTHSRAELDAEADAVVARLTPDLVSAIQEPSTLVPPRRARSAARS